MTWFQSPLDERVFELINRDTSNTLFDLYFPLITDLHKSPAFVVVALLGLAVWIYRSRSRGTAASICLIAAVAAADLTAYRVFKQSIERPRPAAAGLNPIMRTQNHSGSSFPSNHAANVFAAGTVLAGFLPQARWIFYGIAGSVAYSRVYVGVHYPSDVVAGSLLGWILGKLSFGGWLIFARRQSKRQARRV
jgi:undecaprenyl-diphosphatase